MSTCILVRNIIRSIGLLNYCLMTFLGKVFSCIYVLFLLHYEQELYIVQKSFSALWNANGLSIQG